MNSNLKKELSITACKVRMGIIEGTHNAKSGHPGGSLSAADILTYLYFAEMNVDPQNPAKPDRDRFVLSKGHIAPALYATLARKGFFPVEELETLRKIGSRLQGHPDMKKIPGVDMSSGSLGQGISAACGMAKGGQKRDRCRLSCLRCFGRWRDSWEVWFGKLLCLLLIIIWTTCASSWTITVCRSMAALRTLCPHARLMKNSRHYGFARYQY